MLKSVFYIFMKNYMAVVKYLFFGRVEIVGREKIPVGKPIIYSSNHQNAFMDALLVGSISPIRITSLTRSDVFGNHAGMWFMTALQMEPIYRMQDGIKLLEKNEQVFSKVRDKLRQNEGILIFSEANHGNEYFLRPLSKGSSRMAMESQEKMEDLEIQVVPVGINYFHHQRPFHKLTMVFGDPINVKDFYPTYKEHPARGINELKAQITLGMKDCLLIPEESDKYLQQKEKINRKNESTPFKELTQQIAAGNANGPGKPRTFLKGLGMMFGIFNFLPLLILQLVLKPIKDIVFYGSLKWASALFLFPLWWVILFISVGTLVSLKMAGIVTMVSMVALLVRQWLIKTSNVSH